mmetsp:Transcript_8164/g.19887  ORF Transcript_8164/g.19887 Transcript_8164/m.19887 type:complete len:341 (-) Transcript_8164:592-1614(-)
MNFLVEPLLEGRKLAFPDVCLQRWHLLLGLIEELSSHHGAQRVRREVPERAPGPVDVLQHALLVRSRHYPEVLLHPRVPHGREVVDGDLAREEVPLDLEPQDHVQRVRHLVGVDADERGLHHVHRVVHVLRRAAFGVREVLVDDGSGPLPEGQRLPHHPLPEKRLALMHGHAECLAHWKVHVLLRPPLLVHGVAALVDRPRDPLDPVLFRVPSGDADVGGVGAASERMHRDVHPPQLEVEPDRPRDFLAHRGLLRRDPIRAAPERCLDLVEGRVRLDFGGNLLDQRRQIRLHLGEDVDEARLAHAGIELIHRGIVQRLARIREADDFLLKGKHLPEDGGV